MEPDKKQANKYYHIKNYPFRTKVEADMKSMNGVNPLRVYHKLKSILTSDLLG